MLGGLVRGAAIQLRTPAAADLADHVRWHADLGGVMWMPLRPRVQSLAQRQAWLESISSDPARWHWEIEAGGTHVGYTGASLTWAPVSESWVWTSLFIDPAHRRRGLGSDAATALHRFLIDYLGLHHGETWLYADDPAGPRLVEKIGYRIFARGHRSLYRAGRYWDSLQGQMTAERFGSLHPDQREYVETS